MAYPPKPFQVRWVALLAEGVERNAVFVFTTCVLFSVALLAEGVDRNRQKNLRAKMEASRPPRGGRG